MASVEEDAQAFKTLLNRTETARELGVKITQFVAELKRRKITSSLLLTRQILLLIKLVVNVKKKWKGPIELLQVIRAFGRRLVKARPDELVIGNVFRRVIHCIKDDYFTMLKKEHADRPNSATSDAKNKSPILDVSTLDPKLSVLPSREIGMHDMDFQESPDWNLGSEISNAITEMMTELENLSDPINKQATDHIDSDDVILIFGYSTTVIRFLEEARRKRNFKVIVAEAAPDLSGHKAAVELAKCNIDTTLVSDSAVFALMTRVNKVYLGTQAVMANGGLLASVGTHIVALAAKHHGVPVVCITGLYKLCPLFPHNRDSFVDLQSPGASASYASLGGLSDKVQVVTPTADYVPPEFISIFVTNTGGHQPSYIYRLLSDYYDINAEEEL